MSPDKYTGPWAPGMLAVWADTGDWVRVLSVGDDGAIHWSEGDPAEGVDPNLEHAAPDWSDSATVGALAGVVRKLYPEWFAISCQYRGSCEAWNVVARRQAYRDRNEHRVLGEGSTEHDAWLAAYHAHRDAAGTTTNDIEVIRG